MLSLIVSERLTNPIRKCTILSDSIVKYVTEITGCSVAAFPGINISRLANKIYQGLFNLNSEFVILHVGTNDINSLLAPEILASYNDLITMVKQRSSCKIAFSACLPRPIDNDINGDKVKELNKGLLKLCKARKV